MEISTFRGYYLHSVKISTFRGYYPHFLDIYVLRGYYLHFVEISCSVYIIHISWKYSRPVNIIRFSWILSILIILRAKYIVISVLYFKFTHLVKVNGAQYVVDAVYTGTVCRVKKKLVKRHSSNKFPINPNQGSVIMVSVAPGDIQSSII